MQDHDERQTLFLLDELLKSIRELSRFEKESPEELIDMTHQCHEAAEKLKRSGFQDTGEDGAENRQIIEKLRVLEREIGRCSTILGTFRDRVKRDLASLGHTRKAIRAYQRA